MVNNYSETSVSENYSAPEQTLEFKGKGTELFGIQLPNWVLTLVTCGLYYPWAKVEILKYVYSKTEFAGSRFKFHGTGKEMFKGFIKAIGIFAVLIGFFLFCSLSGKPELILVGMLGFYAGLGLIIPVAIHGRMRYRLSRTSWRGIHFGYTGSLKQLYIECIKGAFLTAITFGIYGSWFVVNLRKYIIGNIRFGNIRFSFDGEGGELFITHLKGYFLSVFTLGIYLFWYMRDLHFFYVNNILAEQNGRLVRLDANVTGTGYLKLIVGNVLIMVFTLGLGIPFVTVRTLNFVISNTQLIGTLDLENIEQAEADRIGATFEDVSDLLNLDLV
ncbi:YjgN family protein [Adhaeribacter soli]|uniref:DUF898 domain-containing protein n=1 Tax=Adhaeribacter soli TaxID=2607655 RepID=A0A5N1IRH3_9BACT|nr:DUF898 family protein [Adhaeribacter soli]KAA9332600.1 DUF898 domain-containing protein [Adhaeribacter soli]